MRAPLLIAVLLVACGRDAEPLAAPTSPGVETSTGGAQAQPQARKETKVIFQTPKGDVSATVEVVGTPAKIQRGLMHRKHLAPDRGMLFVFGGDRVRSFWMKNTLIPLDMMFVTKDLVVAGVVRDTEPLSLESRSIGIKTRYVVEVNAGWTAKHGINAGTKVQFENLPMVSNPPL